MVDSQTVRKSSASISSTNIDAGLRAHMNKVYALMSIGLFLTGGVAYIVGNNETLPIGEYLSIGNTAKQTMIG